MTKLLILAYDFPPYVSVGGLRPFSWYKYLHLYDIYPIVITRQWQNRLGNALDYISSGYSDKPDEQITSTGTIIKAPFEPNLANKLHLTHGENSYRALRKIITLYNEFFQFILPVGGKKTIYEAADEYLKNNKVDCIIASGDPFILFRYASKLSKKYSIPWIADYRDPWIQDIAVKDKIYESYYAFFERKYLQNAAKITTVSTFIQKQIEENIKDKNFEILLNGYDPDILEITRDIKQSGDRLSIAFTGTVEDWHPIESFLGVCDRLIREDTEFKVELHCYGVNKEKEIKRLLREKYNSLEPTVYFYSKMNNLDFAKSVARHNACLLFNSYSVLGTKIFDFMAVKRKILLCYENDREAGELKKRYFNLSSKKGESEQLQAEMISKTASGIVVQNSEHLKSVLKQLNEELKTNGFISCQSVNVEAFSRVRQAERLAGIVKNVVESGKSHKD